MENFKTVVFQSFRLKKNIVFRFQTENDFSIVFLFENFKTIVLKDSVLKILKQLFWKEIGLFSKQNDFQNEHSKWKTIVLKNKLT